MNADARATFEVEIAFALPDEQFVVKTTVEKGASVAEALRASGIAELVPDFDFDTATVGVWGQVVPRDRLVRDGDRIEVYRPLERDPMEARRQRAKDSD